jgi:hypothetical protein
MTFATRDLYEVHRDPPPERPAGGSPGFSYLVDRLLDSFNIPSGIVQYYEWMNLPAHDTLLGPHGTSWLTINQTMPIVRHTIDAGHPCPLGLVLAHSADPTMLGRNHQVLAWGYEDRGSWTTVKIYDPNVPNDDGISIEFDHTNPAHTTDFKCASTDHIYGFFDVPYSPRNPEPLFESAHPMMRGEAGRASITLATARTANQPLRDLISGIPPLSVDAPTDTTVGSPSSINEGGLTVSKQQHHVTSNANTLAALNPTPTFCGRHHWCRAKHWRADHSRLYRLIVPTHL